MKPSTILNDQHNNLRRTRILAAAAHCFRHHGFHGTGMAKISHTAQTSASNLYHYFGNKEAMIATIVAQELDRTLALTVGLQQMSADPPTILNVIAQIVESRLELDTAALNIEIAAEASRNPRIAQIVREADEQARANIASLLRDAFPGMANGEDQKDLSATVEMIVLLLDGLLIRCIRNPNIESDMVVRLASNTIRTVLSTC